MKNNASLVYNVCLVIGDFVALVSAFIVAYILRVTLDHTPISASVHAVSYISIVVALLPFFLLIFALLGLYNQRVHGNRFNEFGRLLTGCFIGILGVISYSYVANVTIFPARLVTLYGFLLAFCFVILFRTIARGVRRQLFRYGIGIANVLIVGDTRLTLELIDSLAHTSITGYRVVGVVGGEKCQATSIKPIPCFSDFAEAIDTLGPTLNTIIQTELYASGPRNDEVLVYAQEHHLDYCFVPGNGELFVGKIEAELFHSIPVIAVHQTALIGWGRVAKRLTDMFLSSVGIILSSPIILLTVLIIKLTDDGPVFFRQTRLTRDDRAFHVFKFRTMRMVYSGMTPEAAFTKMGMPELGKKYRENGDMIPNDPRITGIGRFLRRTSIDEIPQLFNVFHGDISIVGPRALIPNELAAYKKRHTILSVKSGMTGLAVVSGRRNLTFDERRQLDLYYVQNWSFWGDLVIIARTVWIVLTGRGAE
jgi:exopolysaccharide biosynthesis polyprenyl glycosylphosphotransferase